METFEYTDFVIRAQAGDQQALNDLIEQFEPTVYAIVLRRLRNPSEALEVSQEVFMRAIRKLPQLREPERFAGWLRQIAVRLAINRAVRRPKEQAQDPETFDFSAPASAEVPLEQLLEGERAEHVRDGLQKLKDLDRETLIAFYFDGESIQQMSERFNSPVGTIKRRLHTARHRLKEHLLDSIPA